MVPHRQAGADRGKDSADGASRVRPAGVNGAEAEHDGRGNDGKRAQHDLGDVQAAGALQFTEEQPSPENADERVSVPQEERRWKGRRREWQRR